MQRTDPIANEMEFQEWLARAFEAERERLREAAAAREFQSATVSKALSKDRTQETQHEDER